MEFRPIEPGDRRWLRDALSVSWGSPEVVSRGVLHRADRLPGLVAWQGGERGGYLVHDGAGPTREIVALEVTLRGVGAGRALVEAAARQARAEGCARLRLITTNDNAPAIALALSTTAWQ